MFRTSSTQADLEQVKSMNSRLETLVQELKLEISFYKGETKRLEWEKDILNQDIKRMSGLFKTWVDELQQCHSSRNIAEELGQFNAMVKYPCKSIADLLQLNPSNLVVTSSQPPHFIEYANKQWCIDCGWETAEILGATCAFLQGPLTDKKVTDQFMRDLKEVGYSRMHVCNYRKNGEMFEVNVTVFPVFDSISPNGPEAEVAVLTHFASVMSDFKLLSNEGGGNHDRSSDTNSSIDGSEKTSTESGNSNSGGGNQSGGDVTNGEDARSNESPSNSGVGRNSNSDSGNTSNSNSNLADSGGSGNENENDRHDNSNNNRAARRQNRNNELRVSNAHQEISDDNSSSDLNGMDTTSNQGSQSGSGYSGSEGSYNRLSRAQKFEPKCVISEESFYNFGHTLRLSNLLRLMLSCNNAMVLTNKTGQIIHVNTTWSKLTGYFLTEVEGKTCQFMQGQETDQESVHKLNHDIKSAKNTSITVYNYKKNGEKFLNKVIVVPIHGGYLDDGITHYCGLLVPQNTNLQNTAEDTPIGMEIVLNDNNANQNLFHSHSTSENGLSNAAGAGSNSMVGFTLPPVSLLEVKPSTSNNSRPLDLTRNIISINMANFHNSVSNSSESNISDNNSEHSPGNNRSEDGESSDGPPQKKVKLN